jgi:hypothetical protein
MKQTPRTEMKRFAVVLVCIAIAGAVIDANCVAACLDLTSINWDRVRRSHQSLEQHLSALRVMAFVIIPSMVAICALGVWMIFNHLKDISNENHNA